MEKHLPAILEGIATDIRLNADKRYKKSLENNQGGTVERFFEVGYDFTQLLYSIAPIEIWVIVFASIWLFLSLEYKEYKERKRNKKQRENNAIFET